MYYISTEWYKDTSGKSIGENYWQIHEYDIKKGFAKLCKSCLIYNRSLIVDRLYETIEDALKSLGSSRRHAYLPNGDMVIPCEINCLGDPLQRWHPTCRELWPGEIP